MNTIRDIIHINDEELRRNIAGTTASWHTKYQQSSWIYIGNLDRSITEGDIICVLSQYGEIDDIHLIRDSKTGISNGYAFCKYSDPRSCILAIDNFIGIQLCGRSLRLDHVENYRLPKHILELEEQADESIDTTKLTAAGHAYIGQELANEYTIEQGLDLFAPPTAPAAVPAPSLPSSSKQHKHQHPDDDIETRKKSSKRKKEKKHSKDTSSTSRRRRRDEYDYESDDNNDDDDSHRGKHSKKKTKKHKKDDKKYKKHAVVEKRSKRRSSTHHKHKNEDHNSDESDTKSYDTENDPSYYYYYSKGKLNDEEGSHRFSDPDRKDGGDDDDI